MFTRVVVAVFVVVCASTALAQAPFEAAVGSGSAADATIAPDRDAAIVVLDRVHATRRSERDVATASSDRSITDASSLIDAVALQFAQRKLSRLTEQLKQPRHFAKFPCGAQPSTTAAADAWMVTTPAPLGGDGAAGESLAGGGASNAGSNVGSGSAEVEDPVCPLSLVS